MKEDYSKKFHLNDDILITELKLLDADLEKILDIIPSDKDKILYKDIENVLRISSLLQTSLKKRNHFFMNLIAFFCFTMVTLITIAKTGFILNDAIKLHPILLTTSFCFTISIILNSVSAFINDKKRPTLIQNLKNDLFYCYSDLLSQINQYSQSNPYDHIYFKKIILKTPEITRCLYGHSIVNSPSFFNATKDYNYNYQNELISTMLDFAKPIDIPPLNQRELFARAVFYFLQDIESYIKIQLQPDNISEDEIYNYVSDTVDALCDLDEPSFNLIQSLKNKNVPERIACWIGAYVRQHPDLTKGDLYFPINILDKLSEKQSWLIKDEARLERYLEEESFILYPPC